MENQKNKDKIYVKVEVNISKHEDGEIKSYIFPFESEKEAEDFISRQFEAVADAYSPKNGGDLYYGVAGCNSGKTATAIISLPASGSIEVLWTLVASDTMENEMAEIMRYSPFKGNKE